VLWKIIPWSIPLRKKFRQSLRELAQLYYRTGRYEEAIASPAGVDAAISQRMNAKPQMMFMMARQLSQKGAALLDAKLASAQTAPSAVATENCRSRGRRRDRLMKARTLYDQVIDLYRASAPSDDNRQALSKAGPFLPCRFACTTWGITKKRSSSTMRPRLIIKTIPPACRLCTDRQRLFRARQTEEAKAANNRAKLDASAICRPMLFQGRRVFDAQEIIGQWLQWTTMSGNVVNRITRSLYGK